MTPLRAQRWLLLALPWSACLWQSPMGEVGAPDAGPASRARFEEFASQLVGSYAGTAGSDEVRVTQRFNPDGTFVGTCDAGDSVLLASSCEGLEGEGTYQLTAFQASGAADGVLRVGDAPASQLLGIRLSADHMTLSYLAVIDLDSELLAGLRDAGVSIPANGRRAYVTLTRLP